MNLKENEIVPLGTKEINFNNSFIQIANSQI